MKTNLLLSPVLIGFAVFLASAGDAQTPAFRWAQRLASTTNTDSELAIGLAIDGAANVYVTGWFDGTNDFGGIILTNVILTNLPPSWTNRSGEDIFMAKYDSGGVLQWVRQAGSSIPGRDRGRGIGLDEAGNVYVAGGYVGYAQFDSIVLSGGFEERFFVAKYDPNGMIQWVRQSAGANLYGTGLAVDGAGNSISVGYLDNRFGAGLDANVVVRSTNSNGHSTFLVKFDREGYAPWAQLLDSPDSVYSTAVALDKDGNIYVGGNFKISVAIGTTNLANAGNEDGFLAKFNGAGVLQWIRQLGGGSDASVLGVFSADASSSVYVAGGFGNTNGDTVSFGDSITLTNMGGGRPGTAIGDAFLAKYDAFTGNPQWAVRAGGTNLDVFTGVSTDPQGNVYVSGATGGTGLPGGFNAMVAKYDTNGVGQWVQSSTGANGALVLAGPRVDASGNCFIAGWLQTNAVFGPDTLVGRGYWDFFLSKVGFTPLTLAIQWSNSSPQLSVSGDTNVHFALEYVSALAATNHWLRLLSNTLTSNPTIVSDTNVVGSSNRFYRATLLP